MASLVLYLLLIILIIQIRLSAYIKKKPWKTSKSHKIQSALEMVMIVVLGEPDNDATESMIVMPGEEKEGK